MNAWSALTKKEFRLGLPAFLVALILFAGVLAFGSFIGYRVGHQGEFTLGTLMFVLAIHLFFLLFYLIYTLNSERKRLHLWMHTPMPIAGLLLSKLATGLMYMSITFIPTVIVTGFLLREHFDVIIEQSIFNILGLSAIGIFTSAIGISLTFIFFWSIFLTYSQRMNDFLSFLVTFGIFLLLGFFYDKIIHSPFMYTLTTWGPITFNDLLVGFEFEFNFAEDAYEGDTFMETSIFYIGHFVREAIVAVIMFLGACWIIDRKVEV